MREEIQGCSLLREGDNRLSGCGLGLKRKKKQACGKSKQSHAET